MKWETVGRWFGFGLAMLSSYFLPHLHSISAEIGLGLVVGIPLIIGLSKAGHVLDRRAQLAALAAARSNLRR